MPKKIKGEYIYSHCGAQCPIFQHPKAIEIRACQKTIGYAELEFTNSHELDVRKGMALWHKAEMPATFTKDLPTAIRLRVFEVRGWITLEVEQDVAE